jgi:effector-binding domain-containing protein
MNWKRIAAVGLGAIGGVIVAICVVALFLPRGGHIERAVTVNVPQETVFMTVNSLRAQSKWSPWMDLDPNVKATFSGPDSGAGSKLTWASDRKDVGSGTQEITASVPPSKVVSHIVFGGMGQADASLTLAPDGAGTRVTWAFDMPPPGGVLGRYMWMMMKTPIKKDYDKGLGRLKTFAEKLPKVALGDFAAEHVHLTAQPVLVLRTSSGETTAEMTKALATAYGSLSRAAAAMHLTPAGATISVASGIDKDHVLIDAEIPVKEAPPADLPPGVKAGSTYAGDALSTTYRGPYDGLTAVYAKLLTYAAANGWTPAGPSWNLYVNDPAQTAPENLETQVFLPVK